VDIPVLLWPLSLLLPRHTCGSPPLRNIGPLCRICLCDGDKEMEKVIYHMLMEQLLNPATSILSMFLVPGTDFVTAPEDRIDNNIHIDQPAVFVEC
jgi:hypothetical protein